MHASNHIIKITLIIICVLYLATGKGECLQAKLNAVNEQIEKLTEKQRLPKYTISKLQYIANQSASNNNSCV
jgi:hypothetical protein